MILGRLDTVALAAVSVAGIWTSVTDVLFFAGTLCKPREPYGCGSKNRNPQNGSLVNRMDQNLRSISWWFNFDPYPYHRVGVQVYVYVYVCIYIYIYVGICTYIYI